MNNTGVPTSLQALLDPRSVAIVGLSSRAESLGHRVLKNLRLAGYRGPIYGVNPREKWIGDQECFASLDALPQAPECVAIAVSADKVLPALEDAAARGSKAAVVFASGFSEIGEQGRELQDSLASFCQSSGMLVCGPNVLGVRNLHSNFALYSAPLPEVPLRGGVAIAAHSGSACVALSSTGRFGLSHVISVGNAVALDIDDYLDHFAVDPNTRVACLFVEAIRRPDRLAAAAARMRAAGKPVVALKVGRTAMGAAASAAHTGSLASSHTATSAFLREAGIAVVNDLDEMVETCALFSTCSSKPAGDGIAVINISGGEVALTCDLAHETGLRFPPLHPSTNDALATALPRYATPANPLDATSAALADPQVYMAAIRALLRDPGVAVVAVSQDCPAGLSDEAARGYARLATATRELSDSAQKPLVFYSNVAGPLHAVTIAPLQGSKIPVLQGARPALAAIRAFVDWHGHVPNPRVHSNRLQAQSEWRQRLSSGESLSEHEAKRFLRDHGIRTTREMLATTPAEAVRAAQQIGFPVVAKIHSAAIAHKSEAGGIALSLQSESEVEAAFARIMASVHRHAPAARLEGVVIQEMVVGGVEMIAGTSQHPPFGRGVVVGAGGVLVELMQDSAFALAPIDATRASSLVKQTRASRLLSGYRGSAPADTAAFEEIAVCLSQLCEAYSEQIEAIDLNPVAVLPKGQGACVLDALIVLKTHSPSTL